MNSSMASRDHGISMPTGQPQRLPDLNAEVNPFWKVQDLLGRVAYLNVFAIPQSFQPVRRGGRVVGFEGAHALHRFDIQTLPPTSEGGLKASNQISISLGMLKSRWMIIPNDYYALPGKEPPATPFESTGTQRVSLQDAEFSIGAGPNPIRFKAFGTGRIDPARDRTPDLFLGAVAVITEGFGSSPGQEGVIVVNGRFDPGKGFLGDVICKLWDFDGRLYGTRLSVLNRMKMPRMNDTYLLVRYEKPVVTGPDGKVHVAPAGLVKYLFGPDGSPVGAHTENPLRLLKTEFVVESGSLLTKEVIGAEIGNLSGDVHFDLTYPAGPPLVPSNYVSRNMLTFRDGTGSTIGSFVARDEGRSFALKLPGLSNQSAVSFGGFGPITDGTGAFEGIQGVWSDNSQISITPFGTVGLGVFRIVDPRGQYRATMGSA
jgi:hypothetical protein